MINHLAEFDKSSSAVQLFTTGGNEKIFQVKI